MPDSHGWKNLPLPPALVASINRYFITHRYPQELDEENDEQVIENLGSYIGVISNRPAIRYVDWGDNGTVYYHGVHQGALHTFIGGVAHEPPITVDAWLGKYNNYIAHVVQQELSADETNQNKAMLAILYRLHKNDFIQQVITCRSNYPDTYRKLYKKASILYTLLDTVYNKIEKHTHQSCGHSGIKTFGSTLALGFSMYNFFHTPASDMSVYQLLQTLSAVTSLTYFYWQARQCNRNASELPSLAILNQEMKTFMSYMDRLDIPVYKYPLSSAH